MIFASRENGRTGSVRRRGGSEHDTGAGRIQRERDGRRAVHNDGDPQDLDRRKGLRQAGQRREEHGEDRTDGRGKLEPDELQDVVVEGAPLSHRAHDRCKVIIGQHHSGGFLRDGRASEAHGYTDIGALQGRRVIDAVARHGDHVPLGLQRPDDFHLMRGGDAGEDPDIVDNRGELSSIHTVELSAADGMAREPQCPGNRRSGGLCGHR